MSALEISNLTFKYPQQAGPTLEIPHFTIARGEKLFMFGPSGSGKTTLLGLVGGLFNPSTGAISVLGQSITAMSSAHRDKFRASNVGFIFQIFNLVPYLNVIDNVLLPCKFGRSVSKSFSSSKDEAVFLIEQLGLKRQMTSDVSTLSIGQQQRVAAARALIGSPGLIIADEPTSALDFDAREDFLRVLFEQAKRESSAILFVSHDKSLASQFDRSVPLADLNVLSSRSQRGLI